MRCTDIAAVHSSMCSRASGLQQRALRTWASIALCMMLLCTSGTFWVAGETFPGDKQALLSMYDLLSSRGDFTGSWSPDSDPCDDGWVGVLCDGDVCRASGLGGTCIAGLNATARQDDVSRRGYRNVTGLFYSSLGSTRGGDFYTNRSAPIIGKLAPSLGNLTRLRVINLGGNLLSGTIPLELAQLPELEQVLLSDNVLRGTLPAQLAQASSLALLDVANNVLNGSLPEQWCDSSFRASLSLEGNLGLCGYVPPCLAPRTLGIVDTGLISPANPRDAVFNQQLEACCNVQRPVCSSDSNCGVAVPLYWTNNTIAQFAFTPFTSPGGGSEGDLQYYWTWSTSDREPNQEAPQDGLYRQLNMSQAVVGPLNTNATRNFYRWANGNATAVTAPSNVTFYQFSIPFLDNYVLAEGVQYYVYVFGVNATCPNARSSAVSPGATVIVSPPTDGEVVVNNNQGTLPSTDVITFVYRNFSDRFLDPNQIQYTYVVTGVPADGGQGPLLVGPKNITGQANARISVDGLDLVPGQRYAVTVSATNQAGQVGNATGVVLVETGSQGAVQLALGLSLGLVALFALITGLLVWLFLRRHKKRELARVRERTQLKSLRTLLTGMSSDHFTKMSDFDDVLRTYTPMCFVVTDLENSTGMAAADKAAYTQLQQMHDVIVREYINKHSGYEINTEGDSFSIAFLDVPRAVLFCLNVQQRLLETNWPQEVLRLPTCKPAYDAQHELAFKGPRVRMGIHYAPEMTVFCRKHPHTKHWEFRGPGFQVAKELGDAANGGQVLMTDHAWVQLSGQMADAGFPVVCQLGKFKMPGLSDGVFLYEVQGQMGRMLSRKFGPPRTIIKTVEGIGFDLGLPPTPLDVKGAPLGPLAFPERPEDACLAFVVCRLVPPDTTPVALSDAAFQLLREKLDICSSQYEGYMFHEDVRAWGGKQTAASMMDCRFFYAFDKVLDAVRFAHVAQMYLMADTWDSNDMEPLAFGETEQTPDGRLLFRGPRMAMVVSWTADFEELDVPSTLQDYRDPDVRYIGEGVDTAGLIVSTLHGGQVVLDAAAWEAVHEVLPLQCQALDLGVHYVWPPNSSTPNAPLAALEPMQLMEVMPGMLSYRDFPPLRTFKQLQPGYRDAPPPNKDMVIMFLRVVKPREVGDAQQCFKTIPHNGGVGVGGVGEGGHGHGKKHVAGGVHGGEQEGEDGQGDVPSTNHQGHDEQGVDDMAVAEGPVGSGGSIHSATRTLEHWHIAVSHVDLKIRALLLEMDGYECKEPEPGKFTIAWSNLESAIIFSAAVHMELMQLDWDPAVLQWEDCTPTTDDAGHLLWRGLRIKVGMAYGTPTLRKPLNTGRADYFGALPNLAARVCSLARPGQSLLDVSNSVVAVLDGLMQDAAHTAHVQSGNTELGMLVDGMQLGAWGPYPCDIRIWGRFSHPELKGIPDQRLIATIRPLSLAGRWFERPRQSSGVGRRHSADALGRLQVALHDPAIHDNHLGMSVEETLGALPPAHSGNGAVSFSCGSRLPPALTMLTKHYRQKHRMARIRRRLRRNRVACGYGTAPTGSLRAAVGQGSMAGGTEAAGSDASDNEHTHTHSGACVTSRSGGSFSLTAPELLASLGRMEGGGTMGGGGNGGEKEGGRGIIDTVPPGGGGGHGGGGVPGAVPPAPNQELVAAARMARGILPLEHLSHVPLTRLSVLSHTGTVTGEGVGVGDVRLLQAQLQQHGVQQHGVQQHGVQQQGVQQQGVQQDMQGPHVVQGSQVENNAYAKSVPVAQHQRMPSACESEEDMTTPFAASPMMPPTMTTPVPPKSHVAKTTTTTTTTPAAYTPTKQASSGVLPSHASQGRCTRVWYEQQPGDLGMRVGAGMDVESPSFVIGEGIGVTRGTESTSSAEDLGQRTSGSFSKEPLTAFVPASSQTSNSETTASRRSRSASRSASGTTPNRRGTSATTAYEDIVRNAMLEARVTIEGQRQMSQSLPQRLSKAGVGSRSSRRSLRNVAMQQQQSLGSAAATRRVLAPHVDMQEGKGETRTGE